MPLLTQQDLYTHVYKEILEEIVRDYKLEFATAAAFPATGQTGIKYLAQDSGNIYIWQAGTYAQTADKDKVQLAIAAGEAEAKAYLNRFDKAAMFVATNTDELLRNKVKDIVCWHLIRLANPNIDMQLFRTLYDDAIKFFKQVMTGDIDPDNWPLKDDAATGLDESGHIEWNSNTKRKNHY